MNIFAGNFTTKTPSQVPDIDYDIVQIDTKNFFIMGGSEEIKNQKEIQEMLTTYFGELHSYDISIDSVSSVEILNSEYEEDTSYECVHFEGPNVGMNEIIERFADSSEVIAVREGNISEKYGNRVVIVDFLY